MLDGSVQFLPIKITAKAIIQDAFLADVIKILPLINDNINKVNVNNSQAFPPTVFKSDFDEPFLIAREKKEKMNYIVIVSQQFVNLCKKTNFKLTLKKYFQAYTTKAA